MITSPIWFGVGVFLGRLIGLFNIDCMCLILLNIDIFYWIFFPTIFFSLRSVMTWNMLHFPDSFWLDISSITCWKIIGYFITMLGIQKLVLFLDGKSCFHGLLFIDWEIYDMLWCSLYCATIPIGVRISGKSNLTSNISPFMKVWSER